MKREIQILLTGMCLCIYASTVIGSPQSGPVGKIEDNFTVTPMGQVNYEIPIPAVPGTGGMTPKLSVTYNSSTKSALFGYGFDLTGLSIINRVPRNKYNDGISGYVSFSSSDNYSIDGVRLLRTSYGTSVRDFSTENDSFSKITSYGTYEDPDSFIVRTKDGLKYDYLPNTKILDSSSNQSALFWMLTRVTDTKGNYFTVNYTGNNHHHEIYPSRIDYTGNVGAFLQPYASVRFSYEASPDSAYTYVYGKAVRRSKCIKTISLYSGETRVKRFECTYSLTNHKKQLTQIKEYAADGSAKNPTTFQWYNIDNVSLNNHCYSMTPLIYKASLTLGDYNGDGKMDFLATPENGSAGWTGWKLFLSIGDSLVLQNSGNFVYNDDEVRQVVSGDFNGDGLDDIVVLRKHNNYYNSDLYLSTGSSFLWEGCKLSLNRKYSIRTVEVNGDGLAELFAWIDSSDECKILRSGPDLLGYTATRHCSINWDEIEFGDFNGDGLTDIYNCNDNASYIMFCDGYSTYTTTLNAGLSKKYNKHFGDFNGDGKTDMLVTSWNNMQWSYWELYASNGMGGFSNEIYSNMEDVRSKIIVVTDINGDGFDDCVGIDKTNSAGNMTSPTIWINDGTGHHFTSSSSGAGVYPADKWNFYFGDFNGDGKGDMLCTAKWINGATWKGYQLFQASETPNLLLSKITDGFGNTTDVTYKYLTNSVVHTKGLTYDYPLSSFTAAWPVVYEVKTPDGIGGLKTTRYKYENALIHREGRGVLGFEKVIVKDLANNTTTTTEYGVEENKYVIGPTRTETKVGNRIVAESNTVYNTLNAYASIFSYHPISITEKQYEYTSGTLLSQTATNYEYDNYGNVTTMVSTIGDVTTTTTNTYTNDTDRWILGRLTYSSVTKTGPAGSEQRHAQFGYDPSTGLMTAEVTEPDNQDLGFRKVYQRDAFGNITQSTTTRNATSYGERHEYTYYDDKGRYIIGYSNSLMHTVINTVDEDNGLLIQSEDANNNITTYTYDSFGRITQTSTDISQTTSTNGWSSGMPDAPSYALYYVNTQKTGEPYKLEFFDCLGRCIRIVTENAFGNKIYCDVVYNSKGQVAKTSEPYFPGSTIQWNVNTYDAAGRIIKQVTPGGAETNYSYNGYNTTTTDALGHQIVRTKDQYGNLVQTTDQEGGTIQYQYDLNGRCTRLTGPRTTVTMEYDLMGNRTLLNDPDIGQVSSTYNAFGELVSQTDSKGTTTYIYDNLGRLTREVRPDVIITSTYDTNYIGSLTSTSANNGTSVSYQYDTYGRTIRQTDVIGSKTFQTQTTYNNLNKIDVVTYPSGLGIKHLYSTNGILNKVKNNTTNSVLWQLTQQDARGNVTQEIFGNGLTTTTTYNAATGYLTGISTPGIQDWTYQYNLAGNLVQRKDNAKNLTESFEYDSLDRLIRVKKNGQLTQEMTYDATGNILSKTGVGSNFTYQNGTNRLTSYEPNGYTPKYWDEIQYNSFHKISHVTQDNKSLSIMYGPGKNRVKSVQSDSLSSTTKYYVGLLYEESYTGSSVRKICYIFAAGKAIAIQETTGNISVVRYLHHDHLGSIQAYSNEQGNLVQELSYDAWGRRRNPSTWEFYTIISDANAWQERGFGGHEHLDIFEMVNMDGRMYDPVLGRFLSPDPIVQEPDFTQGLNRYSYCLNNPLSLIDPSGYSWLSKNWKSLVAATVGITVSVLTMGSATPVAVILAGAAGGAAGALTGALLNGANIGQIAKATFLGAVIGGAAGLLNGAAGDGTFLEQLFKHTFSQGWLEGIQGGNMIHGFMMGAVSSSGGHLIHNNLNSLGNVGEISLNAILSGTVSEIGGGKFANGAVTGAFAIMFNDMMHGKDYILKMIKKQIEKDGELVFSEAYLWYKVGKGKKITVDASKIDLNFIDPSQFEVGNVYDIQTWNSGFKQGIVYGGIKVCYIGDNYVTIKNDKYDFDMHPWDSFKEIVRNLETIGADLIHGKGTPFEIKFKGVNKINHTYNKIKNIIL